VIEQTKQIMGVQNIEIRKDKAKDDVIDKK